MKTIKFIQRDIDRLRIEKADPDAPKKFILESIATNEARLKPLDMELLRVERIKQNLIQETDMLVENAIRSLCKPEEEESK
jgi:hypothetical protein